MQSFGRALLVGWIVISGLSAAWAPRVVGQSTEARRHFETGNEHYAQGDFQAAIGAYQAALGTGYASGALYYNLGNAYFHTDNLGPAILYYEKARRLLPNDPKLLHSLDVAQSAAEAPPPPVVQGWKALVAPLNPTNTFVLGCLLYGLGIGALIYRYWRQQALTMRWFDGALLAGGILLIGLALVTSYVDTLDRRTVVIAQTAPLYPTPTDQATRDTTLTAGTVLRLQRRQPSWTEVQLSSGHTGWMRTDALADV